LWFGVRKAIFVEVPYVGILLDASIDFSFLFFTFLTADITLGVDLAVNHKHVTRCV
jgi:hypothetical protein